MPCNKEAGKWGVGSGYTSHMIFAKSVKIIKHAWVAVHVVRFQNSCSKCPIQSSYELCDILSKNFLQWQCWKLFIIYRNWKCCCVIFVSIDPNMAGAKKSLLVVQEWNLLGGQGLLIQMPSGYAAAFIDGLWIGVDWSKVYGEGWGSTAFSRVLTSHFTTRLFWAWTPLHNSS